MKLKIEAPAGQRRLGHSGRRWLLAAILGLANPGSEGCGAGTKEPTMKLSVTVDFPSDVSKGPFDAARLDAMMATIQDLGARQVNWMYYPAEMKFFEWAPVIHGRQTIATLGEPLRAAVAAAHAHGLEIYAVQKPYGGGASGSYPDGSPEAGSTSRLTKIGGTLQYVIPFLEAHPEMRLQRQPPSDPAPHAGPIREIRLVKADAAETRLRPEHLQIWVSENNYKYRRLPLMPQGTVGVEPAKREVRDYYGNVLTRAGDPVRVMRLTGLELHAPFVVLTTTFAEGAGDFRNTPIGMIEVFGEGSRPLVCVVATHAASWIQPRDFRTYGLEYDMGFGHLAVALDEPWKGVKKNPWQGQEGKDPYAEHALFGLGPVGGFVGIALGRNEFLPAVPCEAYPEVRAKWLSWVRAMLDAGVDGVDLRISGHGCLSDEPWAYGWNPPVVAAYREKFGSGPVEPGKLAMVRGDFYTIFLREAAALVRARGKKLRVHLHAEAFRPDPAFGQLNGFPANIDFQWRRWIQEGLMDEVTLRTSWYEAAEDPLRAKSTQRSRLVRALADPVATEMLAAAAEKKLPVTLNRYIGRTAGLAEYLDDLTLVARDGRFAGFDVYEFFDLAQAHPTQPGLTPQLGRVDGLKARWQALRAKP
ncbi:MAG: hypothetical protein EXS39_01230 [Opitutaceae bacterium]|nr:hypothetical protein [Opitutaceae bacterium]